MTQKAQIYVNFYFSIVVLLLFLSVQEGIAGRARNDGKADHDAHHCGLDPQSPEKLYKFIFAQICAFCVICVLFLCNR